MKYRNREITENEYLYGVPASNYKHAQILLCNRKIKDAKMLLADLRNINEPDEELIRRYQKIEKAIDFNRGLIIQAEEIK